MIFESLLYYQISSVVIRFHLWLSVTPLQKGKTTTDYTNYTDFSLEEIRVICEIRGKKIGSKFHLFFIGQ